MFASLSPEQPPDPQRRGDETAGAVAREQQTRMGAPLPRPNCAGGGGGWPEREHGTLLSPKDSCAQASATVANPYLDPHRHVPDYLSLEVRSSPWGPPLCPSVALEDSNRGWWEREVNGD